MIDRRTDNQKNKDADGNTDIQRRHTNRKKTRKKHSGKEKDIN